MGIDKAAGLVFAWGAMDKQGRLAIASAGLFAGVGAVWAEEIGVREEPAATGLPVVAWVAAGDAGWRKGPPLFELREKGVAITARGWVGMTAEDLLVRVEVADSSHVNDQTNGMIWNGDFLRLSVDGWGDGTRTDPADTANVYGPDDASIGFAVSSKGPQGWVFTSRHPELKGAYPAELMELRREAKAGKTVYDVRVPWRLVGTAAGLAPSFGVSVQIRDTTPENLAECGHLRWGGDEGRFVPGLFHRLAAGRPAGETASVVVLESALWEAGRPLVARAAVAANGARVLELKAGEAVKRVEIPAGNGIGQRRYRIEYAPAAGREETPLEMRVAAAGGGAALAEAVLKPSLPGRVIADAVRRLDDLLRAAEHPLFLRHLASVKALVESEWARARLVSAANATQAAEVRDFAARILAGLHGAAGRWESYWRDGMPLRLCFASPLDGTLQGYALTLPKGWDPAKGREAQDAYPLYVELHGAGHPNPLSALATFLENDPARALDAAGYGPGRTYAMEARRGYHVMPHGRGNLGYVGPGEADVWEALADFGRGFRYDGDRQYLYGFSMGGGGTWRLATRTPDRWAAAAIYAPAILWRGAPPWAVAENLRNLPVWMWTGEADSLIADQRLAVEAMRGFGIEPVAQTTPGVSHEYLKDKQEAGLAWMERFTRKRPDQFSFVADTPEHLGVWGVEMKRDLTVSAMPRFACAIEGRTVRIESTGTPSLTVNAGAGGLGLEGEVTVIWNGKEAYRGPALEIALGGEEKGGR